MCFRELLHLAFEKDHHGQSGSLLALVNHFQDAGVGDGETDNRANRFAGFIRCGDAKRHLVTWDIVGAVGDNFHFDVVFGLPEQQTFGLRNLFPVINGGHDHAVQRARNTKDGIRKLACFKRDPLESDFLSMLAQRNGVLAFGG